MKKISLSFSEKLKRSKVFQEGRKLFADKKVLALAGVKFNWYRTSVSKKQWNDDYSKRGYTYLGEAGDRVEVGFMAVEAPDGCLAISNPEELRLIDMNYRSRNLYPRPLAET